MLQYQLNHGNGWHTQNRITPEGAEKVKAYFAELGSKGEGKTWRVFDPAAQPTEAVEAVEAVKAPRAPRAPRKATGTAGKATTGRKATQGTEEKPTSAKRAPRARKATTGKPEGTEGK